MIRTIYRKLKYLNPSTSKEQDEEKLVETLTEIQNSLQVTKKRKLGRMKNGKRFYPSLDIKVEAGEPYYIKDENTPHNRCMQCENQLEEGDKVFLLENRHNLDVKSPFPYCNTCVKKEAIAQKL